MYKLPDRSSYLVFGRPRKWMITLKVILGKQNVRMERHGTHLGLCSMAGFGVCGFGTFRFYCHRVSCHTCTNIMCIFSLQVLSKEIDYVSELCVFKVTAFRKKEDCSLLSRQIQYSVSYRHTEEQHLIM
jgi:hypothetical protein